MHEPFIDVSGPSLGVLRILLLFGKSQTLIPLWHLINNQGPVWHYGQVPVLETRSYKVIITLPLQIHHHRYHLHLCSLEEMWASLRHRFSTSS